MSGNSPEYCSNGAHWPARKNEMGCGSESRYNPWAIRGRPGRGKTGSGAARAQCRRQVLLANDAEARPGSRATASPSQVGGSFPDQHWFVSGLFGSVPRRARVLKRGARGGGAENRTTAPPSTSPRCAPKWIVRFVTHLGYPRDVVAAADEGEEVLPCVLSYTCEGGRVGSAAHEWV